MYLIVDFCSKVEFHKKNMVTCCGGGGGYTQRTFLNTQHQEEKLLKNPVAKQSQHGWYSAPQHTFDWLFVTEYVLDWMFVVTRLLYLLMTNLSWKQEWRHLHPHKYFN